jgi:hypothetical protein
MFDVQIFACRLGVSGLLGFCILDEMDSPFERYF